MTISQERIAEIRKLGEEITARLKSDPEFLRQARENPVATLHAEGLPIIAVGHFLRETGFPTLGTEGFSPRNEAEFDAAVVASLAECVQPLTELIPGGCWFSVVCPTTSVKILTDIREGDPPVESPGHIPGPIGDLPSEPLSDLPGNEG